MGSAAVLFVLLASYQLHLPGLHYDEAKEAGINAVQLLRGLPVQAFRGSGVRVGSALLPLMVQDYIGALNVYLAVPILSAFGVSVSALRSLPVALAAVTLLLVYALTRELYGRAAAAAASLLLAVNPSYVFWSRQGIFVTNVTALVAVASSLSALLWWRTSRPRYLCVTAFLWGLGIYAKLLFAWVVIASAAIILVLLVANRWRKRPVSDAWVADKDSAVAEPVARLKAWHVVAALSLFVVALLPMLVFNLQTGGTLRAVAGRMASSYYGVSNTTFFANALVRLKQIGTLLRGDHFWYIGGPFGNGAAPWIIAGLTVAALLGVVVKSAARRTSPSRGLAVCWLGVLFCLLVALQSSFTISDLFITHYAIVLPFVFVAAAGLGACVVRCYGRVVVLPVVAALLWWGVADASVTVNYHEALSVTGGHAAHSDVIYKVSAYLLSGEITAPVAMDWGIEAPVYFLTEGRVRPVEVFGYERLDAPDAAFDERLRAYMSDSSTVYIFHVPEVTVFEGRREGFDRLASDEGLSAVIDAVFYERSGSPVYVVARLVRP